MLPKLWQGCGIAPAGDTTPTLAEVLCQHGVVHFLERGSDSVKREEIVCPPRLIADTSADTLFSGVLAGHPHLDRALASAKYGCLAFSSDCAKANLRLITHVLNTLPENTLGLLLRCLHHQDCLTVKPVTIFLDLASPLFCTVKQLQKGASPTRSYFMQPFCGFGVCVFVLVLLFGQSNLPSDEASVNI